MRRKTTIIALLLIVAIAMPATVLGDSAPDYRYETRTWRFTDTFNEYPELVGTVTIPNYIGSVDAVLDTTEGTADATVHVVYLPNDKWDDDSYYSALSVRFRRYGSWIFTGATSIVGWKDLYSYGFLPIDGGMSVVTPEGAEIHLLAGPGLYTSLMTIPLALEDTGIAMYSEAMELGLEELRYTAMGVPFLLVLNDDMIERFMDKGILEPSSTYDWPGLRELILEARYEEEPEIELVGLHNFVAKRPYTRGMFLDMPYNQTAWYDSYVEKVVRIGLMVGDTSGRFVPAGDVKLSEVIAMAARLHNIYIGESGEFSQGPVWYNVYVRYALANGIIREGDFVDFNRSATRGEMAYILASAVPADALACINAGVDIPDVNAGIPYSHQIFQLYAAGVLTGYADGSYHPLDAISRAETAAIIARIADVGLRVER